MSTWEDLHLSNLECDEKAYIGLMAYTKYILDCEESEEEVDISHLYSVREAYLQ